MKTPCFDENVFGNIFKDVKNLYNEQKNFSLHVAKILSKKSRGFFIFKGNLGYLKKLFDIAEEEEIIPGESFENLLQAMEKSRGKKIFFIFSRNFFPFYDALTEKGFVYGSD